jgi:SOS-response transcriptional repressor LexA
MTLNSENTTTKAQDAFLQYWREYEKTNGNPPTMEQARIDLGYASISGIQRYLEVLEKKGLMGRQKHRYWFVK